MVVCSLYVQWNRELETCVCVREKEIDRLSVCVFVREKEIDRLSVCV